MAPTHQLRAIKHMTNRRPKPSGVFLSAVDVSGRRVQPGAPASELRERGGGVLGRHFRPFTHKKLEDEWVATGGRGLRVSFSLIVRTQRMETQKFQ